MAGWSRRADRRAGDGGLRLGARRRGTPGRGHHGLPSLGEDLQAENPYRGTPDYELAQKIGDKAFNQNCARCHGLGAVSGGIAPDVRFLIPVDDDGYFLSRVMTGSIRDGVTYMPPFEGVLSQEAIWAIRSWLDTVAEQ